jgi:hypothetical protein
MKLERYCFKRRKKNKTHGTNFYTVKRVIKNSGGRAPVAHACNPTYSGGRDQEDHDLKPAWFRTVQKIPSQKTPSQKGLEWLKV